MGKIFKLIFTLVVTGIEAIVVFAALSYIDIQRAAVQLESVRHSMDNQVTYQAQANAWSLYWLLALALGVLLIAVTLWLMYRKEIGQWRGTSSLISLVLVGLLLLTGCGGIGAYKKAVIITPPNYGIVVNMDNKTDQATGNSFESGDLLNVTKVEVDMRICAANSDDRCPNIIVAEVQGSPESRIYTQDPNTGTSGANQSLCFEAKGANGCLDFSITAIVLREDARCYANKMGVKPAVESDGKLSRYHYIAMPLAEALDTRTIQIAGSQFARSVVDFSPLKLALDKFELFDKADPIITKSVHDQTCVSILDISINGGVVWASPEIQDQINQATILANQLDLVAQQNELLAIQTKAFTQRALELEKEFGLEAAVEFMKIMKWDGTSFLAFLPQAPAMNYSPVPDAPVPQPTVKP